MFAFKVNSKLAKEGKKPVVVYLEVVMSLHFFRKD